MKTRWRQINEKVISLIFYLYDYKIKKDYEGKDMESGQIELYEDIMQMMASFYSLEKLWA